MIVDRRYLYILLFVAVMGFTDAIQTTYALLHLGCYEANPFTAPIGATFGIGVMCAVGFIGTMLMAVSPLFFTRKLYRYTAAVTVSILLTVKFLVILSNFYQMTLV